MNNSRYGSVCNCNLPLNIDVSIILWIARVATRIYTCIWPYMHYIHICTLWQNSCHKLRMNVICNMNNQKKHHISCNSHFFFSKYFVFILSKWATSSLFFYSVLFSEHCWMNMFHLANWIKRSHIFFSVLLMFYSYNLFWFFIQSKSTYIKNWKIKTKKDINEWQKGEK